MKLSEYVKNLNTLLETRPETAEYEVVSAIDDEGNGFNPVVFEPTVGLYDEREWTPEDNFEVEELAVGPNAVCIN
jgi:hypothetical protein